MKRSKITFDEMFSLDALYTASIDAARGKHHYKSVINFEENRETILKNIHALLHSGNYRTYGYIEETIYEHGKERHIMKLQFAPHRIVQCALINGLKDDFLNKFYQESYAAIPRKGMHLAASRLRKYILKHPEKSNYCYKIDFSKYFESIDQDILSVVMKNFVKDASIFRVIVEIIYSISRGIPIGNYTSQYLANIFLTKFDKLVSKICSYFSRYMDDCVFICATRREANKVRREVEYIVETDLHLSIKSCWSIFSILERGIDYVGFRIFKNALILRKTLYNDLARACRRVLKSIKSKGYMSDSERSTVMSYWGWASHCTKKAKEIMYEMHFKEIFNICQYDINK